jgi:hypothetical protein
MTEVTREQQHDLDPILNAAAGTAERDRIMAAYQLGRAHSPGLAARLQAGEDFIRDLAAPVPPGHPPAQALPADIRTFLVAARAHYEVWKVALDNHSAGSAALTSVADDLLAKYAAREESP